MTSSSECPMLTDDDLSILLEPQPSNIVGIKRTRSYENLDSLPHMCSLLRLASQLPSPPHIEEAVAVRAEERACWCVPLERMREMTVVLVNEQTGTTGTTEPSWEEKCEAALKEYEEEFEKDCEAALLEFENDDLYN